MTTVLSKSVLVARRQAFRRRRWLWRLLGLWRVMLAALLAALLVWLAREPFWQIRTPQMIAVNGQLRLSTEQIRSEMGLVYPQSLFELQPERIEQRLRARLPLASVRIQRQLWPPSLAVVVTEREPVAFAPLPGQAGVLDAEGAWIALARFAGFERPQLTIWGYSTEKAPVWKALYPDVARSPVAIRVIDLRDPGDLVLRTELGEVHLGPDRSQFSTQLRRLDQLREAIRRYPGGKIAYIDLRSSELPVLRLREPLP